MSGTVHPGGSYRPQAERGGVPSEVRRLETQAELSWAHEWRVLAEWAPAAGGAVLDAGCGTGAVTRRLRRQLADPGTRVVGLDADERLLAVARAERPVDGIRYVAGDVARPPLHPAEFDLVLARYVFQHLADPVGAARALAGLVRPGGWFAVVDVDAGLWGCADPDLSAFSADAYRALGSAQAADGGDRLVARRLPRILRAAGLTEIVVRPFAYTSDEVGGVAALAPQLSPERLLPLVERGAVGLGAYARAMAAWERFVALDGFTLLLGFVVGGRVR
ncbi:class I SAM-dependent methyltransferase [Embleya scabrispora]|uniref:class I SAM-dependent methyltransferase n=1 Tax=Embleya scabrispora TaxID=159449 RepID=UPI00037A8C1C|nr:methyltransferase domain-containing protein [Embleya scabrispora]MYS83526.1 methyltransferase domain-containing protein [Streptomyces sp. SID5474]